MAVSVGHGAIARLGTIVAGLTTPLIGCGAECSGPPYMCVDTLEVTIKRSDSLPYLAGTPVHMVVRASGGRDKPDDIIDCSLPCEGMFRIEGNTLVLTYNQTYSSLSISLVSLRVEVGKGPTYVAEGVVPIAAGERTACTVACTTARATMLLRAI